MSVNPNGCSGDLVGVFTAGAFNRAIKDPESLTGLLTSANPIGGLVLPVTASIA
jgi:hypothetical protein